jgi:glycosyltransferase involved in cell wall biosynthesis
MIVVNARFLTQPLTGVQRYAFEVSMQIKLTQPDTLFVCPPNILQTEWANRLQAEPLGPFTGHLWEQITLARFMGRHPEAVLFCPGNTGPLWVKNQWITVHDLAFLQFPQAQHFLFVMGYRWLIPRLLKNGKGIFTVSETIKQEIMKTYAIHADKIQVTYNGLAAGMKKEKTKQYSKEKMILMVGSLSARKNIRALYQGFLQSGLASTYSLVIFGNRAKIYPWTQLPDHPNIFYVSHGDDECLLQYYQRAAILCSLSLYEGFGLPILEALHFGCRVICSDIPVYHELYQQKVRYCSTSDAENIAQQLRKTAADFETGEVSAFALPAAYDYEVAASKIIHSITGA